MTYVDLIIQMNTPQRIYNSEVRETLDILLVSGGLRVSLLCLTGIYDIFFVLDILLVSSVIALFDRNI